VVVTSGLGIALAETDVVGFDPGSGEVMWRIPRARGPLITPAVGPASSPGGVLVYTEGLDSRSGIVGLDLSTRARLWRVALKQTVWSSPSIDSGHVYVGGRDQFVYALDLQTGEVLWKTRTNGLADTSPAIGGGKVLVVSVNTTLAQGRLYALDAATGKVVWSHATAQLATGDLSSSVAIDGGRAFAGLDDRTVRAFDLRTGSVLWSQPVRAAFVPVAAPAVSAGAVYVSDSQGALYRFDAHSGARAWVFQFPDFNEASSPVVAGGAVFLGAADGTVGAVDPATGRLLWKTRYAGAIGNIAPAGEFLLASLLTGKGGVIAMAHDPAGRLVDEDSPTTLHLPLALANFAAAFALVLLGIFGLFRLLSLSVARRAGADGRSPDDSEMLVPNGFEESDPADPVDPEGADP
jgi:outer membrane protein assembly factor BamB